MKDIKPFLLIGSLILCSILKVLTQPMFDLGTLNILGVQVLQDRLDQNKYYYVPPFPRLAQNPDSSFNVLCIKYSGKSKESNGGIFHALIEFSLPDDILLQLNRELVKINPKGKISGPVNLLENESENGEEREPSFRIISAVLSPGSDGKNNFTSKLIASGKAPITPGARAAVAAQLDQIGATLLWNSLQSNTSDVSVAIDAFYEAYVHGYNALVTADSKIIYQHFSAIQNRQKGFQKEQIRRIVDSLSNLGGIEIKVFDRSASLNVKTSNMESILNIVTNKLVERMFNLEAGWTAEPTKINPNEGFKDPGKNNAPVTNAISQVIDGVTLGLLHPFGYLRTRDNKYKKDDQYVLKDIKDIKERKFVLNLSKSSTIKVPIHTAGNLGGFFDQKKTDHRYFKIVNLEDPAFQRKEVSVMVNGKYMDGFGEWVNYVTFNFRKQYAHEHEDVTGRIGFSFEEIKKGVQIKTLDYPRLGIASSDWEDYEYQIHWNLLGGKTFRVPLLEDQWIKTRSAIVNLDFPLEKSEIYIDTDKEQWDAKGVKSALISFASSVFGDKTKLKDVLIRASETELNKKINLYHDAGHQKVYRVTWYFGDHEIVEDLQVIKDSNYLTLIPQ